MNSPSNRRTRASATATSAGPSRRRLVVTAIFFALVAAWFISMPKLFVAAAVGDSAQASVVAFELTKIRATPACDGIRSRIEATRALKISAGAAELSKIHTDSVAADCLKTF